MARKRARRKSSGGGGSRAATAVLVLTLCAVLVFVGSALVKMFRGSAENQAGLAATAAQAPARDEQAEAVRSGIRVEVWNGSGLSGVGQKVAEALKDGGFRVVDTRNADRSDYGTTLIVDRKGDRRNVEEVVKYFHGGHPLLMTSAASPADVRVVVGRDYEGLKLTP